MIRIAALATILISTHAAAAPRVGVEGGNVVLENNGARSPSQNRPR
jgi:hypothetical protein